MRIRVLVTAWFATATSDGLFSSVLAQFFYGSTVARLWQGVASTLLGPTALDGGLRTVIVGMAMHFGVAFAWTSVFYAAYLASGWLRRVVASRFGPLKIAVVYGPLIWMVMSFIVIPTLTGKPASITYKWWIQFFGHMVFVALPMVATISREERMEDAWESPLPA
jgi:hypothetical protein